MKETDIKQVKSRSILSMVSLFFNSSYTAILGFTALFILTWKSSATLFGLYNTVLASMTFFNYITNLGLGAALVQKKEIKEIDLNSAFYTQLVLVTIAVGAGFYFGDVILSQYKDLPNKAIYLYWALLASLFILSFKTIPSVLMDKDVQIYKNVIAQIVEKTFFYLVIIILVFAGYDIEALIVGTLAQAVIGTLTVYILRPWTPSLQFSFISTWELLKFGIPFQGNSFLALVKDDLMTMYLGATIGLDKLGIVYFGKKYAEIALRIITDNINRVSFPLFSKIQESGSVLSKGVQKVLFYNAFTVFPVILGALFVFDSFLHVIPGDYYAKWHGALFSFYFFSVYALLVSMTTPLINLFNAVKKVHWSLGFMVIITVFMWILIPVGVSFYGMNAIAVGFFLSSLSFFIVLIKAKHLVQISLLFELRGVFLASGAMCLYLGVIRFISLFIMKSHETNLIFSLVGAPLIYFFIMISIHGFDFIKQVLTDVVKRKEPGIEE